MKKVLFLIMTLASVSAYSQGFDWQYSFRLPYSIPSKFIGLSAGYSINSSTGDFEFLEDYTPCCSYQQGQGNSLNLGIVTEYWIDGISAVNLSANYQLSKLLFSQTVPIPRSDGINDYIAKYKYEMEETRNLLTIQPYYKYRLIHTHWAALAGFNIHYLLNYQSTHSEEIISPEDERFIDGTNKRVIKSGMYGKYNTVNINPIIGLNYDFSIYRGYYTSFSSIVQIPLTNVIQNENWKEWKIQISLSIFRSID